VSPAFKRGPNLRVRVSLRNAERTFKATYPRATIEGHTSHAGVRYYLVRREPRSVDQTGEGKTKLHAWKNACERAGLIRGVQ
jgi:hypothetical protein